jgi:diguanylate cyclase (GGDEF)-like protein
LIILTIGEVPERLRGEIAGEVGRLRWVEADPNRPADAAGERPHLIVVGEGAAAATELYESLGTSGEIVPVLSIHDDPEADLTVPPDDEARAIVVRAAVRMARLRREAIAACAAAVAREPATSDRLHQRLALECDRAARYEHPVAVILLSVDGVDELADTHGAGAVEGYVQTLAATLLRSLRSVDALFRSGENEITILLPETGSEGALVAAERLRTRTTNLVVKPPTGDDRPPLPMKARASLGVAVGLGKDGLATDVLLERARRAMETVRAQGGDRVLEDTGTS